MEDKDSSLGLIEQPETETQNLTLQMRFGSEESRCVIHEDTGEISLEISAPVMGGAGRDLIGSSVGGTIRTVGSWSMIDSGEGPVWGAAVVPFSGEDRSAEVRAVYLDMLQMLKGSQIYRIWNFVPGINAQEDDLENYRAFNIGRWQAFEESGYLELNNRQHPAASAVGIEGKNLAIAFCAGKEASASFENPFQVPAWKYPKEYGPKSPCFVRGAVVDNHTVYLSGTASILGHESTDQSDLSGQFDTTMENVDIMLEEMGTDRRNESAQFRIYLRNQDDFPAVLQRWKSEVSSSVFDRTCFLQADICRKELIIEIEAIVSI